jgi:hypothetical protein
MTWNGFFRRSSAARFGVSQSQTGTGLELTISRLLAGVMGGDIHVTSTVGVGSTFSMKMLLSEGTNPTRIAPVDATIFGYHGPRKTILITDDDPTQRDLLREVLAPLGFILLSAPDGPACLSLGPALPARPVPARHIDVGHGWMDGGGNPAIDRPPSRPHPDGLGQRTGSPWHAAGAAVS